MLPVGLQHIASRHSTRSFDTTKPVPRSIILDILDGSRSLPTSANTQPWTIIVVQGGTRDQLSEKMLKRYDAGDDGTSQYPSVPQKMTDRMGKAFDDYSRELCESYGPDGSDENGRRKKYRRTFEFYGAPVHILICAPQKQCVEEAVDGIPIDMGTLLTAILLGAHSHGLGGAPQFSVAKYHDICREVLGKDQLPDDLMIICGLSIGWPSDGVDPRVKPGFFPSRLIVDATTRWMSSDWKWLSANHGAEGHSGDQSLLELIKSRHCSHKLDTARPVAKDIIYAILEAARNVPSTKNTQPWNITVIQGEARDKLSNRMLEHFDAGNDGKHTYKKYSSENTPQMQKAKDTYAYELYEVRYGLDREDKVARRLKYRPNYELWGGPVMLLLTVPKSAVAGTWLDAGSFMYAILLGMHCYGLGGKPLGSIAKYTDVIQEVLGEEAMPDDEHLVCGITIGWPCDGRDPRTTPDFFPSRLTLEETTRWVADPAWLAA